MATDAQWYQALRDQADAAKALADPQAGLIKLVAAMDAVAASLKPAPAGGAYTIADTLRQLAGAPTAGKSAHLGAVESLSTSLAGIALRVSGEAADGPLLELARALTPPTGDTKNVYALLQALAAGAGAGESPAQATRATALLDILAGSLGTKGTSAGQLVSALGEVAKWLASPREASAQVPPAVVLNAGRLLGLGNLAAAGTNLAGLLASSDVAKTSLALLAAATLPEHRREQLAQLTGAGVKAAADLFGTVMEPMLIPFGAILDQAHQEILAAIRGASQGGQGDPTAVSIAAVKAAFKIGRQAHGLAIAAESALPFGLLGFRELSAAVVDLAGFGPLSQAAMRAQVQAAIAAPAEHAAAREFHPRRGSLADLAEWIHERQISLEEYRDGLLTLGYRPEDVAHHAATVYRDFTVRDIATVLDDVTVDDEWLSDRIRTIGYDDVDAEQLVSGIRRRARRGPRGRLQAAAAAAATDGLLSIGEYEGILRGLGIPDDVVATESAAVGIRARADYQRQAIATYRRQYVNDVIGRGDYQVALAGLGLVADRIDLELADADAQRAPKIQADEEAAVKDAISQARSQLAPKYRALFRAGAISAAEYQRILEQAGYAPAVAAQAVSLDTMALAAAAAAAGRVAATREFDRLLADRRQLVITQFRKGIITAAQLRAGLIAAGLDERRADAQVATEEARKATARVTSGSGSTPPA